MPGKYCCVCKNTTSKDPSISFHRFPSNKEKHSQWLEVLQITENQLKPHWRVCSRHFPDGDPSKLPTVTLGKRFCSPMKKGPRAKRAQKRRELSVLSASSPSPSSSRSSRSVTPLPTVCTSQGHEQATFQSECSISSEPCCSLTLVNESLLSQSQTQVTVNTALLARIDFLESENASLKKDKIEIQSSQNFFNIEQIHNNDELVRFYTGFIVCFSPFINFLVLQSTI